MRRNWTIDTATQLKDAGAIAASAAAQVGGAAKILDLGAGFVEGDVVLDVTALDLDGNNEIYDIVVQLSPNADFGTAGNIVERAQLNLCAKEVKRTDCDRDDEVGRYVLSVDNEFDGTLYRYMRLYTIVAGAGVTTGINYTAYFCKRMPKG
jgi:hypothetical protein